MSGTELRRSAEDRGATTSRQARSSSTTLTEAAGNRHTALGSAASGFLAGVPGPVPLARAGVVLAPVAEEVDAEQRLRAGPPAEVDDLSGPDAVRLLAAPDVIAHERPRVGGADALPPLVVAAEEPAEADHVRGEIRDRGDEVLAPIIGVIVPGGLDGAVGDAERLHELHVQIGRDREERGGIDPQGVGTAACRRGREVRGGEGAESGRQRALPQEIASRASHGRCLWPTRRTSVRPE
jgi:hypothetical protein